MELKIEKYHSLTLRLGNTFPSYGDSDRAAYVAAWKELHQFFSIPKSLSFPDEKSNKYHFKLDASDVISAMEIDCKTEASERAFSERMNARESIGARALSCDLLLNVRCVGTAKTLNVERAVYRFLQQFFVAMNIALPGSLSMYYSTFLENTLEIDIPNLSADWLEASYHRAIEDKWPKVSICSVADTWLWLDKQGFHAIDLAETASVKAAFSLLLLAHDVGFEESSILAIARALEALFADSREGIQTILNQRLNLVLGEPEKHKNWLTGGENKKGEMGFYALRSAIAHGRKVLRPGMPVHNDEALDTIFKTYVLTVERPISVLIAILQDLVQNKSTGYCFEEKFKRICPDSSL